VGAEAGGQRAGSGGPGRGQRAGGGGEQGQPASQGLRGAGKLEMSLEGRSDTMRFWAERRLPVSGSCGRVRLASS
jgi:hypothetical protein